VWQVKPCCSGNICCDAIVALHNYSAHIGGGVAVNRLLLRTVLCWSAVLMRVCAQLFDGETWTLDTALLAQQPLTLLPSRLKVPACLLWLPARLLGGCMHCVP
jgi:hypothetical protein